MSKSDVIFFQYKKSSKHLAYRQSKKNILQLMHTLLVYCMLQERENKLSKITSWDFMFNWVHVNTHEAGLSRHVYKCSSPVTGFTEEIRTKQNSGLQGYTTKHTNIHACKRYSMFAHLTILSTICMVLLLRSCKPDEFIAGRFSRCAPEGEYMVENVLKHSLNICFI